MRRTTLFPVRSNSVVLLVAPCLLSITGSGGARRGVGRGAASASSPQPVSLSCTQARARARICAVVMEKVGVCMFAGIASRDERTRACRHGIATQVHNGYLKIYLCELRKGLSKAPVCDIHRYDAHTHDMAQQSQRRGANTRAHTQIYAHTYTHTHQSERQAKGAGGDAECCRSRGRPHQRPINRRHRYSNTIT